ncbi:hypothetical protein OE749_14785 [Aestuariibacter sp. AA17]|uniref:Lipoprotein n=1 Tax=Fluctibacter corallii TaxID=2984329 RepID=A0ABT3ABB3_9ALTE|nr:hypothetical protein [Aestuariibacter sp. AA17]MCV2885956.1 hypothetical protein [Aestuariibacter sp. AA17]
MKFSTHFLCGACVVISSILLSACEKSDAETRSTSALTEAEKYIHANEVYNEEAVIPPQCYTKTEGVNNPCYVCHQSYPLVEKRPNAMNDGGLQGDYAFSDIGVTNSWRNLFIDRTPLIADISDEFILKYISEDNYSQAYDEMSGRAKETNIPQIKNLHLAGAAFADNGLAKDGSLWVAYNYKLFPSTFWPTNGSTGDAMIRLDRAFREKDGQYNEHIYFTNLALAEMAVKGAESLPVEGLSETEVGVDLNADGELSSAVMSIRRQPYYVGDAEEVPLVDMLFPEGTELLHTVRYLGIDENGETFVPPRMKEVRYMKKHMMRSRENLLSTYYTERKEKHFEKLPRMVPAGNRGIANGYGWTLNAMIEDKQGQLRPQASEELAFCNGCHRSVGSTIDQTFSFARKVDGEAGWGYLNLRAMTDVPSHGEEKGEYLTYLERVQGGDEFRQNKEMLARWFEAGEVKEDKIKRLSSIFDLVTPSSSRALALNKAYYTIVKEQSYLFGRDATLTQAENVLQDVDESQPPLDPSHRFNWDIRLNWQHNGSPKEMIERQARDRQGDALGGQ